MTFFALAKLQLQLPQDRRQKDIQSENPSTLFVTRPVLGRYIVGLYAPDWDLTARGLFYTPPKCAQVQGGDI